MCIDVKHMMFVSTNILIDTLISRKDNEYEGQPALKCRQSDTCDNYDVTTITDDVIIIGVYLSAGSDNADIRRQN